ncbi:MAG: formylglycine-generating enzyme family protein [Hyphomicrobiales bacterium]|nr:formylglycine-generating enzyme family protein [Hyphomicrobiales bacterium]
MNVRRTLTAAFACFGLFWALADPVSRAGEVTALKVIEIPAGPFVTGSSDQEREAAYRLDEKAYGHSRTRERKWYAREGALKTVSLGRFAITETLITNNIYSQFVRSTGHRRPSVTAEEWKGYGLVHPFTRAKRHIWANQEALNARGEHPVVLVSYLDAEAFAAWYSNLTGKKWRLPSEAEWTKAARGTDGRWFPWGNDYDAGRLNSHDEGPFDTMPVGSFKTGASPFGLLDAAGQVFEWTSTAAGPNRHIVKGGSWDDKGCGVCRPAARHSRPDHLKHILIGFRLVRE